MHVKGVTATIFSLVRLNKKVNASNVNCDDLIWKRSSTKENCSAITL